MWLQATKFSYLGLFFGVAILIGFGFGNWLDKRWHTGPWLMMLGVMCGIAAGFKELIRLAKQFSADSRRQSSQKEAQPAPDAPAPSENEDRSP